jgi:hypothetical protein
MHTNFKLNFSHDIGFEVFQDNADPTLQIFINDEIVFNETFAAGILHKRTAEFYHDYLDCKKNCVRFKFTGEKESPNRYIKLKRISINDTYLNILQPYYKPTLNQEWWDTLNDTDRKEMLSRIHGNCNGIFGWYGTFDFYFNSGMDFSSKYRGCSEDKDTVIGVRPTWVTLVKNTVTKPWHGKTDD